MASRYRMEHKAWERTRQVRREGACLCAFVLLFAFVCVGEAWAADCVQFFRKGQPKEAGECFQKQADDLGESSKLPPIMRYRKGRLMLNAARLYVRAAEQSKNKEEQIGLYNRALGLYRRYMAEELFESEPRKREMQREMKKLEALVPATPVALPRVEPPKAKVQSKLTILSGDEKALICVSKESGMRRCQKGAAWTLGLSPGPYLLSAEYPSSTPQTRLFTMKAGHRATYAFAPPYGETPVTIETQDKQARLTLEGGPLLAPLTAQTARWEVRLQPGRYRLMVAHPQSAPYPRSFQVIQGTPLQIDVPRPSIQLRLTSTPPQAQIFVDGVYSGLTPSKLFVSRGSYTLKIKRVCYRSVERRVDAEEGGAHIPFFLEKDAETQSWLQKKQRSRLHPAAIWVPFFAGLALVGLGGLGYGMGASAHQEATRQRRLYENAQTGMEPYAVAYENAARSGNSFVTMGHLGMVLGLIGMGVGTFLFVRERPDLEQINACDPVAVSSSPQQPTEPRSSTSPKPLVSPPATQRIKKP